MFGPGDTFPYAPERKYTPVDASKEQLFALRDRLGFDKNVIVQATCHGTDNRALVDALRASNGRARGVATVDRERHRRRAAATMHDAGVRGTRFNFVKRLVDFTPREVLDRDRAPDRAARLARRDLLRSGRPAGAVGLLHVTADHRGRRSHGPSRRDEAGGRPGVRAVRAHDARARQHLVEGQLSRATDASPARPPQRRAHAYRDVVPFAKRLVETFPDRVLWGTDWPHPELEDHMPDDGLLVD